MLSLKHHARVYISPTSHCAHPGSIAQGLFTDHIVYAKPQGHECRHLKSQIPKIGQGLNCDFIVFTAVKSEL